jgi:hypothetical protein
MLSLAAVCVRSLASSGYSQTDQRANSRRQAVPIRSRAIHDYSQIIIHNSDSVPIYTQCPSFVEDNPIVCHSERSEESRHFFALIELSNAGILRFALQKLDELLVSFEKVRPGGPEGVLPAFCAPRMSSACRPLIPGGDRLSSRGQRPRKSRPQQGATLKGSNPGGVTQVLRPAGQANATPPGSEIERGAFRGRCPRLLSCALAGHENLPLGLTPRHPVSDITDSHFRLCMLRMTSAGLFFYE